MRSYLYQRRPDHKHRGIDLPAKEGTPVRAAAAGTVRVSSNAYRPGFSGYGKVVVLEHPGSVWTLYAHLADALVEEGAEVTAGQQIGIVGRTRYTKENPSAIFGERGAHLHFEVSPSKYPQDSEAQRLDPVAWLSEAASGVGVAVALLGLGWLVARALGKG
jgi:murein DD-endopeptidase MepM/ murein hydrolase activator NlpD